MEGHNDHIRGRTANLGSTNISFDVLCSVSAIADGFSVKLESLGFKYDRDASIKIILDIRWGFALHTLETLDRLERSRERLIVLTFSSCPEYWEDLWDMHPDILIVQPDVATADTAYEHELAAALVRAARGERYRVVPENTTLLTPHERAILRYVARAWANKDIAQLLHMQEKTVTNMLTVIYDKLNLDNRPEAILYYWDLWFFFGSKPTSKAP